MPLAHFVNAVDVQRTPRVLQLEGLFDVPPSQRSVCEWDISLPIEKEPWQIGLIVGPSGSGKSTAAKQFFSQEIVGDYDWPKDRAVVDGFPSALSIKEITEALSSVGFSSPPSWLRPFHCLSTGEQFRATLARALLDPRPLVVVDEFTSVIDRTVAQIGSAAVAKAIRRLPSKQFVAVTCHQDVADWLDPDWILEMPGGEFSRRLVRRRPPITLEVGRVTGAAWNLFKHVHYMTADHHQGARCFVGFWRGRPVVYCSVIHFPHSIRPGWKEHRTVCLPDYQGVGIGNAMSNYIASIFKATGKPYRDTTAHPAHAHHRLRSPWWKCTRGPSLIRGNRKSPVMRSMRKTLSTNRITLSFEYIGPARHEEAKRFGLLK